MLVEVQIETEPFTGSGARTHQKKEGRVTIRAELRHSGASEQVRSAVGKSSYWSDVGVGGVGGMGGGVIGGWAIWKTRNLAADEALREAFKELFRPEREAATAFRSLEDAGR